MARNPSLYHLNPRINYYLHILCPYHCTYSPFQLSFIYIGQKLALSRNSLQFCHEKLSVKHHYYLHCYNTLSSYTDNCFLERLFEREKGVGREEGRGGNWWKLTSLLPPSIPPFLPHSLLPPLSFSLYSSSLSPVSFSALSVVVVVFPHTLPLNTLC